MKKNEAISKSFMRLQHKLIFITKLNNINVLEEWTSTECVQWLPIAMLAGSIASAQFLSLEYTGLVLLSTHLLLPDVDPGAGDETWDDAADVPRDASREKRDGGKKST